MKKGFSFLCIISALLCLSVLSCKLKVEEDKEELLQKPDIHNIDGRVTLIIPKINSKTDYINIYRKDSNNEEIVGVIYPKDLPSGDIVYDFIDKLVIENVRYQYKVRYHDSDGFHYSDWSDELKIQNITDAYSAGANLVYGLENSNTKFQFSETDYTLKVINGAITAPTAITNFSNDYIPALVIKAGSDIRAFEIKDNPEDFLDGTTPISMRGFLPNDFKDKDIAIVGLIGETKEYINPEETDETKLIAKYIRWTSVKNIKVSGHNDGIIMVPSESGSKGHDLSRSVK